MIATDKWIAIDQTAVEHNLTVVRSCLQPGVRLIAVLKANAYGHGAVETARCLSQWGVDFFAVTHLQEAQELRAAGIKADILLFTPLHRAEDIVTAARLNLSVSVGAPEDLQSLGAALEAENEPLLPLKVHLQLDTGLGRFGYLSLDSVLSAAMMVRLHPQLDLSGVYTHMANAAGDEAYTRWQFAQFNQALQELSRAGFNSLVCHCANSATLLKYPEMQLNAVRVGTLLSGQLPVGKFASGLELRDPYQFKCRIVALRALPAGSYLGYFSTYRLRQDALVGVIPVGYRDGLLLEVGNPPQGLMDLFKFMLRPLLYKLGRGRFQHRVKVNGVAYPLRGKVFMQLALVEFPPDAAVKIGDEVVLPIRKVLAPADIPRFYFDSDDCE